MARILIVEDNGGVERALLRWLSQAGHEVTLASASDSWQDREPDVVLLDLHPAGWETLDLIRAHWPAIGVVVITGADEPEVEAECAARGAQWCPKPFTRVGLLGAVADAAGQGED